jgi:4'-phosphopantetheinyl transferase EntD
LGQLERVSVLRKAAGDPPGEGSIWDIPVIDSKRTVSLLVELDPANRRREWIAGRLCLAEACARFSSARTAILPGPLGAPSMPEGLSGSISHKGPLVVALAANSQGGIGVDVECVEETDDRLAAKVLTARERTALPGRDVLCDAHFVAMHFATKEAIYKALTPAYQATIDFHQIELRFPQMNPGTWLSVNATVRSCSDIIRVAALVDDDWIIAAARRD